MIQIRQGIEHELWVNLDFSTENVEKMRTITRRWNPKQKHWVIPYDESTLKSLYNLFLEETIVVVDESLAKEIDRMKAGWGINDKHKDEVCNKCEVCIDLLNTAKKLLKLKGYSENTINAYMGQMRRFLTKFNFELDGIDQNIIQEYLLTELESKGRSNAYVNQTVSAVKFLCRYVLKISIPEVELPRPKREEKLPNVLSKEEVLAIFQSAQNLKHRALLTLAYSAGLRVSEVVSLRVTDIDSKRMLIHVRQGKGRKDRYTILSQVALETLRNYAKKVSSRNGYSQGKPKEPTFQNDRHKKYLKMPVKRRESRKRFQFTR